MARIEVPVEEIREFRDAELRSSVVAEFNRLGFKFVTLDLSGFRSGNLNRLIPPEELRRFS
jgi:uncharacterized protein